MKDIKNGKVCRTEILLDGNSNSLSEHESLFRVLSDGGLEDGLLALRKVSRNVPLQVDHRLGLHVFLMGEAVGLVVAADQLVSRVRLELPDHRFSGLVIGLNGET